MFQKRNAFLLGFGEPDRAGLNAGRLCASRRRLAMAGIALVEIRLLQLAGQHVLTRLCYTPIPQQESRELGLRLCHDGLTQLVTRVHDASALGRARQRAARPLRLPLHRKPHGS